MSFRIYNLASVQVTNDKKFSTTFEKEILPPTSRFQSLLNSCRKNEFLAGAAGTHTDCVYSTHIIKKSLKYKDTLLTSYKEYLQCVEKPIKYFEKRCIRRSCITIGSRTSSQGPYEKQIQSAEQLFCWALNSILGIFQLCFEKTHY